MVQQANTLTPGPITPQNTVGPKLEGAAAAQTSQATEVDLEKQRAAAAELLQTQTNHREVNELISSLAKTKASFTNNVAERFSIVEILMGVFLSLSRRRLDDFAYLMTSCFEWCENKIQDIQGLKAFPKFIQEACVKFFELIDRRNQNGSKIGIDDLNNHREAIVGSANAITALPALAMALINIVKSLFNFGRDPNRNESSNWFIRTILYLAPLVNTAAMWVSAAGKAAPAGAMQSLVNRAGGVEIANRETIVDDYNTTLNSVNEDKLCGMMSAGLVVTPILGKIFPKFDRLIENLYAAYISYKSVSNGVVGMLSPSGAEDQQPRYSLTNLDFSFMKLLDPARKWVSKIFGAKDFALDTMLSLIQNPADRNTRTLALNSLAS